MARILAVLLVLGLGSAPCAAAPDPAPAGTRTQDLELAKTRYVLASPAFAPAARARALAYIEREQRRAERMTPEQFLLCMLRIPAFADNAHDVLNDDGDAWFPGTRLPLRMIWFADGWVVARADAAHAELVGARVRAIEGLGPEALLARMRPLWGGPDASRRWNLEWIIEHGGLLHALGVAGRADRLRLELQLPDGRDVRRSIAFVPQSQVPPGAGPVRLWSPEPWPGEAERGWRTPPGTPPLYLADAARRFRVLPLPDLDALYVQFRSHLDGPQETLADTMRAVDAALEARRPRHLIFDLRFDVGGNSDLTRDWLRTLPARIPGRLYVMVGHYTFSAGIVAAAALKHDAAGRARLVGEEPGDRLVWWSEGTNVCLPASRYCPHLTTGLWNLESGCVGQPACYGDRFDATVGNLTPDLPAPLTLAAWLERRDPGLEAIGRDLAGP